MIQKAQRVEVPTRVEVTTRGLRITETGVMIWRNSGEVRLTVIVEYGNEAFRDVPNGTELEAWRTVTIRFGSDDHVIEAVSHRIVCAVNSEDYLRTWVLMDGAVIRDQIKRMES